MRWDFLSWLIVRRTRGCFCQNVSPTHSKFNDASLFLHRAFVFFFLSLLLLLSSTSVRRLDRSLDSVGESISISLHCYLRAAETKAMAFSVSDDYQSTRLNQITRKKDKEGFLE